MERCYPCEGMGYGSRFTRPGKGSHNYGKIHHFSWEHSLFQWWFSIASYKKRWTDPPFWMGQLTTNRLGHGWEGHQNSTMGRSSVWPFYDLVGRDSEPPEMQKWQASAASRSPGPGKEMTSLVVLEASMSVLPSAFGIFGLLVSAVWQGSWHISTYS